MGLTMGDLGAKELSASYRSLSCSSWGAASVLAGSPGISVREDVDGNLSDFDWDFDLDESLLGSSLEHIVLFLFINLRTITSSTGVICSPAHDPNFY